MEVLPSEITDISTQLEWFSSRFFLVIFLIFLGFVALSKNLKLKNKR